METESLSYWISGNPNWDGDGELQLSADPELATRQAQFLRAAGRQINIGTLDRRTLESWLSEANRRGRWNRKLTLPTGEQIEISTLRAAYERAFGARKLAQIL